MKTKEIITSRNAAFVIGIVFLTANNAIPALGQEDNKFAVQTTGKSIQDPLPGHESRQIVIVHHQEMMVNYILE